MKVVFNTDAFMKRVIGEATGKATLKLSNTHYVDKLGKELEAIGDKTIAGIFPFIANNLIGLKSGKILTRENGKDSPYANYRPFIGPAYSGATNGAEILTMKRIRVGAVSQKYKGVSWKPLSGATIKRKGNDLFFVDSGALQQKFAGTNAVDKLGGFRVNRFESKLKADIANGNLTLGSRVSTHVLLGYLRFNIFGKITSYLGRLSQGDFDDKVALEKSRFGPKYGHKLEGFNPIKKSKQAFAGGDYNRPLVQPVLAFYIDNVIPKAIARSLLRRQRLTASKGKK